MIDFDADLAEMLSTDDFASTCTHKGRSFAGILDKGYSESLGVEGIRPMLHVRTVDVPTVAQGQAIVVDAVVYTIRGVQPDGTGETVLVLEAT